MNVHSAMNSWIEDTIAKKKKEEEHIFMQRGFENYINALARYTKNVEELKRKEEEAVNSLLGRKKTEDNGHTFAQALQFLETNPEQSLYYIGEDYTVKKVSTPQEMFVLYGRVKAFYRTEPKVVVPASIKLTEAAMAILPHHTSYVSSHEEIKNALQREFSKILSETCP